ncbi:MAG: hypothetical protein RL410_1527 [Actinomycetota bacterium]|jgi:16S rRNA (guanine966-N2)-methyltransferase
MTRIIAGAAKGRTLKVPSHGTRPTSDRVRESVFNMLQHRLGDWNDINVLDLYAGSGAYAFESLSRGAKSATVVDNARHANDVLHQNAQQLGFDLRIVNRDVSKFAAMSSAEKFDLVFIDPPYDLTNVVITQLLDALCKHNFLAEDVVIVVERSGRDEIFSVPDSLTIESDRALGETRVIVLVG